MTYKIYSDGNYIIVINTKDPKLIQKVFPKSMIGFSNSQGGAYTLKFKNTYVSLEWDDAMKIDGSAYASEVEFRTFLENNTAI